MSGRDVADLAGGSTSALAQSTIVCTLQQASTQPFKTCMACWGGVGLTLLGTSDIFGCEADGASTAASTRPSLEDAGA